jgi:hypothetical protein
MHANRRGRITAGISLLFEWGKGCVREVLRRATSEERLQPVPVSCLSVTTAAVLNRAATSQIVPFLFWSLTYLFFLNPTFTSCPPPSSISLKKPSQGNLSTSHNYSTIDYDANYLSPPISLRRPHRSSCEALRSTTKPPPSTSYRSHPNLHSSTLLAAHKTWPTRQMTSIWL